MPITLLLARSLTAACLGLLLCGAVMAQHTAEAQPQPVYTRARFVAAHEDAGKPYVRLTLLPRAKLPFSTQTFRLADRDLLAGIADGSPVEFVARRVNGENTVVAIRPVAECKRFQKC
jgi:Cu/Ag efflux protein CusF